MTPYHQAAQSLRENDEQWAAYESPGNCVVLAGPGSGKTKVLTIKMARTIAEGIRPPSSLACVTYNNECARELRARLGELGVDEADGVFVGTLHGFCLRHVVGAFAHLTNAAIPTPLRVASDRIVLSTIGEAAQNLRQCGLPEYMRPDIEKFRRLALDRTPEEGWEVGDRMTDLCVEYERLLLRKGYVDFDGIVYTALHLIEEHDFVRRCLAARFPVLFVDEYQDLGAALHRMVSKLCFDVGVRLFAVGDPDQSIYGFTGARPELLRDLAVDDRVETVQLRLNYRSGTSIVAASKAVLGEPRTYTAKSDASGVIDFHKCSGGIEGQVDVLVSTVLPDLLARYAAGEIVVLHFGWWEGDQIENALGRSEVEYVRLGRTAAYPKTPLTRLIEEFASWAAGGWRTGSPRVSRLLSRWSSLLGVRDPGESREHGLRVARFLLEHRDDGEGLAGPWLRELEQRLVLADRTQQRLADNGHAEALEGLLQVTQAGERLEDFTVANLGGQVGSPQHVNVLTLHSSKGREFDAVVIVGADEGRLPHYRSLDDAEKVREARRLFYVGLSRARHEVRLMYSPRMPGNKHHRGPSRFVEEVRDELSARQDCGR
ncbi:MAG: ATP-dependent helicase [Polyangiaceae bacterium]